MSVPQHIVAHLEDYLDGKLDHSGRDAVLAWSQESDENAKQLAAWFMSEVELLEAARVADMCAVFEGLPFDVEAASRREAHASPPRRRLVSMGWLAIAASLLIAVAAPLLWSHRPGAPNALDALASDPATANASAADDAPPSPAILGRLAKCVWAADMKPLRVGQDVAAGTTIDIQSGLAQLIFESGAKIVLRGPCRLQVDHSMLCRLAHGSVSAEVPPRAAGFTIRGPSAEVIDLGTRFGFSVGAAGKSEVHVFQGEVISRQLDEHGAVFGKEIHLRKNQALLYPGERKLAQRLAANEAKFAIEVRPLWRRDKIEPLAVDRRLALWLRAEHGVQTDKHSRVVAWQDLAVGTNQVANDAFQPNHKARPDYVLDAFGGHPAIRFDGKASYLTTTPMTTTDNQTIIAVFQHLPSDTGQDEVGGQIINYNGPPSRYLPDIQSPGVLQLGEKVASWNGPATSIAAKAFVGRDSGGTDVSAGIVISPALGELQPRLVAYTYNNAKNAATLYVDGTRIARASAPTRVAVTSRKVLGKHGIFDQWYFHGDLSELIIFNTALQPEEVNELSQQLMSYYGIQPTIQRRQQL